MQAPHTRPRAPKAWWPAGAGSWSCPCWATVAGLLAAAGFALRAGPAASTRPLLGHVPCAGLQSRAGSWASEPACRPCVPHAHVGRSRRDPLPRLRAAAPPRATSSAGCCWPPPRPPFVRRRSLSAHCTRAARRAVRRLARAPSSPLPIPRLKIPASKPKLERGKQEQNRDFKRKLLSQNLMDLNKT